MAKFVQGVQAVVQAVVQGKTLMRRGLCRVCRGFPLRDARETKINTQQKNKSLSRIWNACTPCTPCTGHAHQRLAIFITMHNCLHTLHKPLLTNFLKKIMKITCGEENVEAFNREMRANAPAFHGLLKQLYAAGLITGLRGATIETGNFTKKTTPPPVTPRYCAVCKQWHVPAPVNCKAKEASA